MERLRYEANLEKVEHRKNPTAFTAASLLGIHRQKALLHFVVVVVGLFDRVENIRLKK